MRHSTSHEVDSDSIFFPTLMNYSSSSSSNTIYQLDNAIDFDLERQSSSSHSFLSFSHSSHGYQPYPPIQSRHSLPISPPAPHRRAPRPPTYLPKRHRARHIAMREPAMCGLFTVCEDPAEYQYQESSSLHQVLDADAPMDVDVDVDGESSETVVDTDSRCSSPMSTSTLYDLPSAVPSSEVLPSPSPSPSPDPSMLLLLSRTNIDPPRADDTTLDVPLDCVDIGTDTDIDSIHRLSWSSTSTATKTESSSEAIEVETDVESRGVTTPLMENGDPFTWTDISLNDEELVTSSFKGDSLWSFTRPTSILPPQPRPVPATNLNYSIPPTRQTRRPAPLVLSTKLTTSLHQHPFSAAYLESDEILTPRSDLSLFSSSSSASTSASRKLLPALPILSSTEWDLRSRFSPTSPTTPTSSSVGYSPLIKSASYLHHQGQTFQPRRAVINPSVSVDLDSVFEDLLATCGEISPSSSSASSSANDDFSTKPLRFPLPPLRSNFTTPPPIYRKEQVLPSSPSPRRRDESDVVAPQPRQLSNHSFLQSLSLGDTPLTPKSPASPSISSASSTGSSSSTSSRKSLPGRKGLPMEWTKFGQAI